MQNLISVLQFRYQQLKCVLTLRKPLLINQNLGNILFDKV